MDSLLENFQIFEVDSDWQIYEEQLEMLLIAANVQECDKVPILLAIIGSAGYQLLRELCSPDLPQSKSFQDLCNFMRNQAVQKGTKTAVTMDINDQENSTVHECYQVSEFNGNKYEHFETSGHHEVNNSGQLNGSDNVRLSHQGQCDVCDSTEHVRVNCKFKESVLCHQCNGKEHEQGFCHLSSAERFQDQRASTVSFEGHQDNVCESTFEQEQLNLQVESSSMNIGHQPRSKNFKDQGTIFSRNSGHCNIRIKGHFSMNKSVQQSRVIKKIVHHRQVSQFNPNYGERKAKWSRRGKRYRGGHASRKSFMSTFSIERIEHGHPRGNRVVFHKGQVFSVTKEGASCSFKNRHRPGYHKDYGRLLNFLILGII